MPGVMARAQKAIPPQGDYLDKDELIRKQDPMAIASVVYDERPGNTWGPRWVVSVQPWFEDQDEPMGLVTFTANATRNPVMENLQAQIEENHNEPIGPVVLQSQKSTRGNRFHSFADFGEEEPEPQPAPQPVRAARPAAPETTEQPKRRGRPRGSRNSPKATAAESTPATLAVSKPPERPVAAPSQSLSVGMAICPNCGLEISGRVLSDDAGRRVIIHPHCAATNKAEVLYMSEEN